VDNNSLQDTTSQPLEEDGSGQRLVWFLLGVAALGCGLLFALAFLYFRPNGQVLIDQYFPSPTAAPTRTAAPNLTATQKAIQSTETVQAIQTTKADASANWDILLTDDFDSDSRMWITRTEDYEYARVQRTIRSRVYQWEVTSKRDLMSWVPLEIFTGTDFCVTVEAERVAGSSDSDMGLIFRADSEYNFYYFGVGDDGFFVSVNYDHEWINIIESSPSPAIQVGEVNRLTVIGQGPYYIFLINDHVVGDAVDEHIPSGSVGLGFQLHQPNQKLTVQFDNFELRRRP
jgi:hypothetical protein